MTAAADEHRDIGALTAPIGMQLVEYEELQSLCGPYQRPVLATSEQQLEHHVVRQQDIRRIVANAVTCVPAFLPRVPIEPNPRSTFRIALVDELPEFLVLAVGQCVHRIDDDGLDSLAGSVSENVVHDRHDVGEALP